MRKSPANRWYHINCTNNCLVRLLHTRNARPIYQLFFSLILEPQHLTLQSLKHWRYIVNVGTAHRDKKKKKKKEFVHSYPKPSYPVSQRLLQHSIRNHTKSALIRKRSCEVANIQHFPIPGLTLSNEECQGTSPLPLSLKLLTKKTAACVFYNLFCSCAASCDVTKII